MRPKKPETTRSGDLFRSAAGPDHQPPGMNWRKLAGKIDLGLDRRRGDRPALQRPGPKPGLPDPVLQSACYCSSRFTGCPTKAVCASAGSTTPISRFFTGEEFFQHEFPPWALRH